jgi:hypothetical protein
MLVPHPFSAVHNPRSGPMGPALGQIIRFARIRARRPAGVPLLRWLVGFSTPIFNAAEAPRAAATASVRSPFFAAERRAEQSGLAVDGVRAGKAHAMLTNSLAWMGPSSRAAHPARRTLTGNESSTDDLTSQFHQPASGPRRHGQNYTVSCQLHQLREHV